MLCFGGPSTIQRDNVVASISKLKILELASTQPDKDPTKISVNESTAKINSPPLILEGQL